MTKNAMRRIALRAEIARLLAQVRADEAAIAAAGYTLEDPSAHWCGTAADAAFEAAETAGRTSRLGAYSMRTLRACADTLRVAAAHVAAVGTVEARTGSRAVRCYLHIAGRPATVAEHMFTGHGQRGTLVGVA